MGANVEYPTPWYTSSDHRPLARPQALRRDTKPILNSKRDGGVGSRLPPSGMTSVSSLSNLTSTTKKNSSSLSQLFPIDTSELDTVKHMWTQQGRNKRAMELISGDLIGMGQQGGTNVSQPSATSVTSALVSASPSTSTSTSCSSLPSALFSSYMSSSTSSASTITVVCKSSPSPEVSKCVDNCCGPLQKRSKVETKSTMSPLSQRPSKRRSLSLSLPTTMSVTRISVPSTDSPLHILLDQARKEGLCSAELAILENSKKEKIKTHARSRLRSFPVVEKDHSTGQSAPSASRSFIENLVSFASKLPLSYTLLYDVYSYPSADSDIFPLNQIPEKIPQPKSYPLKFPPPLSQPRSPFRAQSSPSQQHPTARFRLVENKEYLKLKAVWNRLAENEVFVDSYEVYHGVGRSFGIGLDDLDCGCEDEGECDCEYEDEQRRNRTGKSSRQTTRNRSSMNRLPPPPTGLVDRQGNLHTGCELIVSIAIDGLGESGLSLGRREEKGKKRRERRMTLSKMDMQGGRSFVSSITNLVSSSKLSSVSYSVLQALDSLRQIGEIQAKHASVGANAYGHKTGTGEFDIHSHRTGPEGL